MTEAPWDAFLTERDRVLENRLPTAPVGLGAKPALLMVDLYRNGFGDTRRPLLEAIDEWPSSCGEAAWDSIPHLQRLLEASRDASLPVIHVTGLPDVPSWRESRMAVGAGASFEDRRRQFEILPEVGPVGDELVIRKSAPSAFWGTVLPAVLNQAGVDSLIVAGQSTSGCVRATVVDACSYRYRVVVPMECVFDRTEAAHAINLFDMSQKYADVLALDSVLEKVGGSGEESVRVSARGRPESLGR